MDSQTDVPQRPGYFCVNGRTLFIKDCNSMAFEARWKDLTFISYKKHYSNTPHDSVSRCGISSGHHKGNNCDEENLGIYDEVVEDAIGKDGGPRHGLPSFKPTSYHLQNLDLGLAKRNRMHRICNDWY